MVHEGTNQGGQLLLPFSLSRGGHGSPKILTNFFLFPSSWESFISRDLTFVINGSAFGFLLLLFSVLFCLAPGVRNHSGMVSQLKCRGRAQRDQNAQKQQI